MDALQNNVPSKFWLHCAEEKKTCAVFMNLVNIWALISVNFQAKWNGYVFIYVLCLISTFEIVLQFLLFCLWLVLCGKCYFDLRIAHREHCLETCHSSRHTLTVPQTPVCFQLIKKLRETISMGTACFLCSDNIYIYIYIYSYIFISSILNFELLLKNVLALVIDRYELKYCYLTLYVYHCFIRVGD